MLMFMCIYLPVSRALRIYYLYVIYVYKSNVVPVAWMRYNNSVTKTFLLELVQHQDKVFWLEGGELDVLKNSIFHKTCSCLTFLKMFFYAASLTYQ